MKMQISIISVVIGLFLAVSVRAGEAAALSAPSIPLDSPVYLYLEKLSGFGLIGSDFQGIKPLSRAEAARLLLEAEATAAGREGGAEALAAELFTEIRRLVPRETRLAADPASAPPFGYDLLSGAQLRYVQLDGEARSYERPVHDPGNDGVFGIGSGLRPQNPYPSVIQQHGSEGTPLFPNNEGLVYRRGANGELRFSSEAYLGRHAVLFAEPLLFGGSAAGEAALRLQKGYLKVGGGGLELTAGRDANWLGLGFRGNLTLTDNARNLDQLRIASPEPIRLRYLGDIKYVFIFSRLDETVTDGIVRHPYFLAAKLAVKPVADVEIGLNLGRQVGGAGVNNSFGDTLRGLVGGTGADNSNSVAGLELRWRLPRLRNAELYGEFSGEDSALFWPIVESYVAGIYLPRLTADGRNDLRFEYFWGDRILYTNGTFPEGYLYHGLPLGHSQGGGAQEFFVRFGHLFQPRHQLALEYFHTSRGNVGRVTVDAAGRFSAAGALQAIERKNAWRAIWRYPLYGEIDLQMLYGWERVNSLNLVAGVDRSNQLLSFDLKYHY